MYEMKECATWFVWFGFPCRTFLRLALVIYLLSLFPCNSIEKAPTTHQKNIAVSSWYVNVCICISFVLVLLASTTFHIYFVSIALLHTYTIHVMLYTTFPNTTMKIVCWYNFHWNLERLTKYSFHVGSVYVLCVMCIWTVVFAIYLLKCKLIALSTFTKHQLEKKGHILKYENHLLYPDGFVHT